MIYPDELRDEVLESVISKKKTPIVQQAREFGISRSTMLRWRKEAGLVNGGNCKKPESSSTNEFSIKEKHYILKETFHMNEHELGEYCRTKGILASDLNRWDEEIIKPIKDLTASERMSFIRENKKLTKEIERKDRALAEAAALLLLSKKAEAIWGVKEEEK